MRWPQALTRVFDGARISKRRAWLVLASVAALVVVAIVVAMPLHDAIARKREDIARDRLVLDVARARAAENLTLARAGVPAKAGDLRATIDRVLTSEGLRYALLEAQSPDAALRIVVDAAPFAVLVRALDALAHDGVRVVEATLAARVDPGTVRAELALTR